MKEILEKSESVSKKGSPPRKPMITRIPPPLPAYVPCQSMRTRAESSELVKDDLARIHAKSNPTAHRLRIPPPPPVFNPPKSMRERALSIDFTLGNSRAKTLVSSEEDNGRHERKEQKRGPPTPPLRPLFNPLTKLKPSEKPRSPSNVSSGSPRSARSTGNPRSARSSSSTSSKPSKKPKLPPPPIPKFDLKKLQVPPNRLAKTRTTSPKIRKSPRILEATLQSPHELGPRLSTVGMSSTKDEKSRSLLAGTAWLCDICAFENGKALPRCRGCATSHKRHPEKKKIVTGGEECKSKGNKNRENRMNLLNEVVNTEIAYVKSVSVLFNEFMLTLANGNAREVPELDRLASRARCRVFFSHTRRIFEINREFLHELQLASENNISIGCVFAEFAPLFNVYGLYAESHERVSQLFKEVFEKKGPKAWLNGLSKRNKRWKDNAPQGSPFFLLIKPVQRVPRYRLLIEELVKLTPDEHEEMPMLKHALGVIKGIATHVNETIRKAENKEKLHALQRKWVDPDEVDLLEGDAGSRHLIKEGRLCRHTRRGSKVKKYVFHLFNDMLLYSDENVVGKVIGSGYKLHFRTFLNPNCAVRGVPSQSGEHLFALETTLKSFVVEAETEKIKEEWIKAISSAINSTRQVMMATDADTLETRIATVAPVWAKDGAGAKCQLCKTGFTLIIRKHHCRTCGKLVCSKCSPHREILPNISKTKRQRVCRSCKPIVIQQKYGKDSNTIPSPSSFAETASNSVQTAPSSIQTVNSDISPLRRLSDLHRTDELNSTMGEEEVIQRILESKAPPGGRRRYESVRRLLRTQIDFCKDLRSFWKAVTSPFLSRVHMKESGKAVLHGTNVPSIVCVAIESYEPSLILHTKFRSDLIRILDTWKTDGRLSSAFGRFAALSFGMHKSYASSVSIAARLLNEMKSSLLAKFSDGLSSTGRTLNYNMTAPMQHLSKITLSFQEILQFTPATHPEYNDLKIITNMLTIASEELHKIKAESERLDYLITLEANMRAKTNEPLYLVSPNRFLIREGPLERSTRRGRTEYHFHLFNDMLLYSSKELISGKYILHRRMLLKDVSTTSCQEKTEFQINSPQKSFIVAASSEDIAREWETDLRRQIKICEEKARREGGGKMTSAPVWVQDSDKTECDVCNARFNFLLNRRHHCRKCGCLCCGKCSSHKMLLSHIDETQQMRVCDRCYAKSTYDMQRQSPGPKKGSITRPRFQHLSE